MVIEKTNHLVETIRELELVEPARLDALIALAERQIGVRDLARLLIQDGYVSAFQVNQLLQGRGRALLLGPYILVERIGAGGMGEVFKARHRFLQRIAAVKVVSKKRAGHANAVKRFVREAEAAAQLSHPNIVSVFDFGEEGETHYLAMEYIDGVDLGRLLEQSGPLPVAMACNFMHQAALGLHHAHEKGFVHRDVKPQNLLVAPRSLSGSPPIPQPRTSRSKTAAQPPLSHYVGGTVKILDMGLMRLQTERIEATELALTQQGVVIGTMDYLAPEQARNSHRVDRRADLYSLGCTLYHLLAGEPVFPGGAPLEKLLRHQTDPPPPLREKRPDVPFELEVVLRELLAKRPEERIQTAIEVASALAPFAFRAAETVVLKRMPAMLDHLDNDFTGLAPARVVVDSEEAQPAPPLVTLPPLRTRTRNRAAAKRLPWVLAGVAAIFIVVFTLLALGRKPSVRSAETPTPTESPEKQEPDHSDPLSDYLPPDTAVVLSLQPKPWLTAPIFASHSTPLAPDARELLDALGLAPERNVESIRLLFPSGHPAKALWLVRSSVDFARLVPRDRLQPLKDGPVGLYRVPATHNELYLGQHPPYLLASRHKQNVVEALARATGETAAPASEELSALMARLDPKDQLSLAVVSKMLGTMPQWTEDAFADAALQTILRHTSTIEVGLHCDSELRLHCRLEAASVTSASEIVETIQGWQTAAGLGLALGKKSPYHKRLWLRLIYQAKVTRNGLTLKVESQVTEAMMK